MSRDGVWIAVTYLWIATRGRMSWTVWVAFVFLEFFPCDYEMLVTNQQKTRIFHQHIQSYCDAETPDLDFHHIVWYKSAVPLFCPPTPLYPFQFSLSSSAGSLLSSCSTSICLSVSQLFWRRFALHCTRVMTDDNRGHAERKQRPRGHMTDDSQWLI